MIEFLKGVFRRVIRGPRELFNFPAHGYGVDWGRRPPEQVTVIITVDAKPAIKELEKFSGYVDNLRAKQLCRDLEAQFGFSFDGSRS